MSFSPSNCFWDVFFYFSNFTIIGERSFVTVLQSCSFGLCCNHLSRISSTLLSRFHYILIFPLYFKHHIFLFCTCLFFLLVFFFKFFFASHGFNICISSTSAGPLITTSEVSNIMLILSIHCFFQLLYYSVLHFSFDFSPPFLRYN